MNKNEDVYCTIEQRGASSLVRVDLSIGITMPYDSYYYMKLGEGEVSKHDERVKSPIVSVSRTVRPCP